MQNSLNDLKNELFDIWQRLKCHDEEGIDPKDTIELDVAKEMLEVSKQIIEISKVECTAMKIVKGIGDLEQQAEKNGLLLIENENR